MYLPSLLLQKKRVREYFPSILTSSVFSDLPFSLPSPQNKVKLGGKKSTLIVSIKSLKDEAKNINLY